MRALLISLLLAVVVGACSTVPGTGRSQLLLLSSGEEMQLGAQAYTEMLAQERIVTSGNDAAMVQMIGERIAQSAIELLPESDAKRFRWEFKLIDSPEMVNAWALPGGKTAVYTGLLPITGDEDSLAIVMGHEVAHAIARHGNERMSHGMVMQLGMLGADMSTRNMDPEDREMIMAGLGVGANVGVMLPFSRSHESEADEIGLMLAANAGYNPEASIGLWQRMGAASSGAPPEWLSTHPSSETRIQKLQALMPEANKLYRRALNNR
ncbi:MAG: M48 family metallopeptidase [Planctomycetes bacterium]|nr:M48 family metallopeptidase [Planctomycetota bacterium]MCP4771083.1 M48 family metallopeptidase [Planctomycetota bacterium]MCP4861641.1 M48 family metallopeptidase [Planctomycetota bacterium]